MTTADPKRELPSPVRDSEREWISSLGLKRLSPRWAKAEIVLGLSAASLGMKLLIAEGATALGGGVLVVLGLYLAMAGHRSHLYQAMNRQNAALAARIRELAPLQRVSS